MDRSIWSWRVLPVLSFLLLSGFGRSEALAQVVTYDYDALGRLKEVSYPNNTSTSFNYDSAGNRISVMITDENFPPTAIDDNYNQSYDTSQDHNVLSNDIDPENDPLTIISETGAYASIVGNKIRFAAPTNSGVYSFDYTVEDLVGGTDTAQVTITVPNVAPVASNDAYTQSAGTTVDRNVLSNDTDANGDTLTLASENSAHASIMSNKLRFASPTASGTYVVTYTVSDGHSGTDTATATFTVPNIAPVAVNDSGVLVVGQTLDFNVLLNDADANGDSLILTSESSAHASIVNNKLRFAAPSSAGVYNVTYTVSDGKGGTDTAVFSANVLALARDEFGSPVAPFTLDIIALVRGGDMYVLKDAQGNIIHQYRESFGCTSGTPAAGYSFTGNGCEIRVD